MNLTNSRHNCQTIQNTTTFQSLLYQQIHFNPIKLKMAPTNMINVHTPPAALCALLLLQQGNLYKLQQKILHDISRSYKSYKIFRKLLTFCISNSTLRQTTLQKPSLNIIKQQKPEEEIYFETEKFFFLETLKSRLTLHQLCYFENIC